MGLMLDTNVFIYSERSGNRINFSKWEEYGDVYISSVTVSELRAIQGRRCRTCLTDEK